MLNSKPPKEEEKQTKAMLQFFENVISLFIKDQDLIQCIYVKVLSFCSSNKMKFSKTNMTFLPFLKRIIGGKFLAQQQFLQHNQVLLPFPNSASFS